MTGGGPYCESGGAMNCSCRHPRIPRSQIGLNLRHDAGRRAQPKEYAADMLRCYASSTGDGAEVRLCMVCCTGSYDSKLSWRSSCAEYRCICGPLDPFLASFRRFRNKTLVLRQRAVSFGYCLLKGRLHAARPETRSMRRTSVTMASSTRLEVLLFLATWTAWLGVTPTFCATRVNNPTYSIARRASGGVLVFSGGVFCRAKIRAP